MMQRSLNRYFQRIWYPESPGWCDRAVSIALLPASWVYRLISRCRVLAYRVGLCKQYKLNAPVVVVGNITAGGTGKTPVVINIAKQLKALGYHPGIITKGYGRQNANQKTVMIINSNMPYSPDYGDESVLLAKKSCCPVAIAKSRVAAGLALIEEAGCDILISDDGLQHYALGRDVEIALVDGKRRFGNNRALPAGPCREPESRLCTVDCVLTKGENLPGETALNFQHSQVYAVQSPSTTRTLESFADANDTALHALAGIGDPQNFFNMLQQTGLSFMAHDYPDHYPYEGSEYVFKAEGHVLMTEKDAIKVESFANKSHWAVALEVTVPDAIIKKIIDKTQIKKVQGRHHAN